MRDETAQPRIEEKPELMLVLGWYAIIGCVIFLVTVLIADVIVPNHDWVADTISDLGAGRYEYVVDIGLYAFSAALIAIAMLAAHVHLGGWGWSLGSVGFACLGLIVFLVGARNEYGDSDSEGVVIHSYLVYAIGIIMALAPWFMSRGAGRAGRNYRRVLIGISVAWTVSAPVYFFLPTGIDGLYERYLGLLALAAVVTLARLFIRRAQKKG